jgi:NTP pyrophosphatase (non-canonical NTP hydrolase)
MSTLVPSNNINKFSFPYPSSLNYYQNEALKTALYPKHRALEYTTLGLVSEAGEVAGKVKKILRGDPGTLTDDYFSKIADELGDVLWYVATLADALHLTLDDVAERNLVKLKQRQTNGTIKGSGDTR